MKLKRISYKSLLAKCLLAVILFFSFFTIAGYACSAVKQSAQKILTVPVYSDCKKINRSVVLYRPCLYRACTINPLYSLFKYRALVLLQTNYLEKIKLRNNLVNLRCIPGSGHFMQIKKIPQNSKEENLISFG